MSIDPSNIKHPDLAERLGRENYRVRIERQTARRNPNYENGPRRIPRSLLHNSIRLFLTITGMRNRGLENFQYPQLVDHDLPIAGLPAAFDGFRILQIADLHLDLRPELLTPAILRVLAETDYDLCVNTGDFVYSHAQWPITLKHFQKVAQAIDRPHFGILGNHDQLEHVHDLENAGVRLLLNEAAPIERNGQIFWLVGVDDTHFHDAADLKRALSSVPPDAATLLLAHAPNFAEEAADSQRIGAMICGHTHGGQICLPGGRPLITHNNSPRERVSGTWKVGDMPGYTSRGTGASGVAARFHCPAEITRHTLRRAT